MRDFLRRQRRARASLGEWLDPWITCDLCFYEVRGELATGVKEQPQRHWRVYNYNKARGAVKSKMKSGWETYRCHTHRQTMQAELASSMTTVPGGRALDIIEWKEWLSRYVSPRHKHPLLRISRPDQYLNWPVTCNAVYTINVCDDNFY